MTLGITALSEKTYFWKFSNFYVFASMKLKLFQFSAKAMSIMMLCIMTYSHTNALHNYTWHYCNQWKKRFNWKVFKFYVFEDSKLKWFQLGAKSMSIGMLRIITFSHTNAPCNDTKISEKTVLIGQFSNFTFSKAGN